MDGMSIPTLASELDSIKMSGWQARRLEPAVDQRHVYQDDFETWPNFWGSPAILFSWRQFVAKLLLSVDYFLTNWMAQRLFVTATISGEAIEMDLWPVSPLLWAFSFQQLSFLRISSDMCGLPLLESHGINRCWISWLLVTRSWGPWQRIFVGKKQRPAAKQWSTAWRCSNGTCPLDS